MTDSDDFPTDILPKLHNFHESIKEIEKQLDPLLNESISDVKLKNSSIDQASLDLATVFTLNSLFWMYLMTCGEDPKEHGIKKELDRIKSYMMRIKQIKEKKYAPQLNKDAAKRFVRNALWDQNEEKNNEKEDGSDNEDKTHQNPKKRSPEDVSCGKKHLKKKRVSHNS